MSNILSRIFISIESLIARVKLTHNVQFLLYHQKGKICAGFFFKENLILKKRRKKDITSTSLDQFI